MVAVEPINTDDSVRWGGVPWEHYEVYLALRGERSVPRIAYLDGVLELMSPSDKHETIKWTIGHLVAHYMMERGIEFRSVGSWTLKDARKDAGLEPDECFILGAERKTVPDLAIEVIVKSGGIKKLEIYRRLGVREVWFWRDGDIEVHGLRADQYTRLAESELVPGIDLAQLCSFLEIEPTSAAIRAYRDALAARR